MQPQLVALDLSFPISSLRLNIRVRFQVRDYPGLNLDTESESSAESRLSYYRKNQEANLA